MTAEIVVVVPVLGRPHHAAKLMQSFRENTPKDRASVLAIDSDTDPVPDDVWNATHDAWEAQKGEWDLDLTIVTCVEGHTFAAKVNTAYRWRTHYEGTGPDWFLLVGSDVEFKPRWLESALITAQMTGAKLIATNDGGLTHSSNGGIATHPLISRQWIDEHGSCWDGPGIVTHAGYGHWSQDSEWSQVAQDAGVYAYSPLSVIEHHHPVFDASVPDDDVYRLGQSTAAADRELFMERLAKYGGKQ